MTYKAGIGSILCLYAALFIATGSVVLAQDVRVSARLGIEVYSQGRVSWAKSHERITTRDKLRIYVAPKEEAYIYIVHTNGNTASLLLDINRVAKANQLIILPNNSQFYQFDGTNRKESITIICSPKRRIDIWEMFPSKSANISHTKWAEVEKNLVEASRIVLGKKTGPQKRLIIGGSVRNLQMVPDQVNDEGDEVLISLENPSATPMTFSATNLPSGLSIDAATGLITGTIAAGAAAGSPYTVTVSASSGNTGPHASQTFTWTVNDLPPDLKDLRMFSGQSMLVKTYEFIIQK